MEEKEGKKGRIRDNGRLIIENDNKAYYTHTKIKKKMMSKILLIVFKDREKRNKSRNGRNKKSN